MLIDSTKRECYNTTMLLALCLRGRMTNDRKRKHLQWTRQVDVPPSVGSASAPPDAIVLSTRERLIAALADRPQTVAQLAQAFGLAQPTVLDQVRRALRDGLIVEVTVAAEEKRFAAERYYAPAVPVIRQTDRELLEAACRALAADVASALLRHEGDLRAAFALTTLAREGWTFEDLRPYLGDTTQRLALGHDAGASPRQFPAHGLAWVEESVEFDLAADRPVEGEEREEASA